MTKLCHCGKPIHYDSEYQKRLSEEIIARTGEFQVVTRMSTMKIYLVPKHYIHVHGIKGHLLDTYGFKEINYVRDETQPSVDIIFL